MSVEAAVLGRRRGGGAISGRVAVTAPRWVNRRSLAAALCALAAALFHVWTGVTVASVGYELSHARELGERLSLELQELEFELAAQTAPARLEEEARVRLGLEPPSAGQVVDLR